MRSTLLPPLASLAPGPAGASASSHLSEKSYSRAALNPIMLARAQASTNTCALRPAPLLFTKWNTGTKIREHNKVIAPWSSSTPIPAKIVRSHWSACGTPQVTSHCAELRLENCSRSAVYLLLLTR